VDDSQGKAELGCHEIRARDNCNLEELARRGFFHRPQSKGYPNGTGERGFRNRIVDYSERISELVCIKKRVEGPQKGAAVFAVRRAKLYPQEERGIQRWDNNTGNPNFDNVETKFSRLT